MLDVAVIGGGAAGFFAAINIKLKHPHYKVQIFEKSPTCLGKVKISGGGRCNVTHQCFDPIALSKYYPRGEKELISVFNRFGPKNTIDWFAQNGVKIVPEADGRMFPITNDSQTIVNCFSQLCRSLDIEIHTRVGVKSISGEKGNFKLSTESDSIQARQIVVSSGSSEAFWNVLKTIGHSIVEPVPSLFTFNIKDKLLNDLQGISMPNAMVTLVANKDLIKSHKLKEVNLSQSGPMLITHWGLSGPAILKLSSIGSRLLHQLNYRFNIKVNLINQATDSVLNQLTDFKGVNSKKQVVNTPLFEIPSRLWQRIHQLTFENPTIVWADVSKKEMQKLADILSNYTMEVNGKSTFKEEFVTAGGVDLKEVDFKTMESKLVPGVFFAGEVLNIDALTGGFNFQAAWSEAWLISESV